MSDSPFLEPVVPAPAPPDARWVWAVVTQSSPLRIKIDGDRVALGITPDDLGGGVRAVGQRVYCQILNRRLVVVGPAVPTVIPAPVVEVPPGVLLDFAGGTVPSGFLLCDGTAVNRTTYAALFAAIGTVWGVGDNSTTFNLPNFQGRTAVGRDPAQTEFDTLGETGGAKTVTLTANQSGLRNHRHGIRGGSGASVGGYDDGYARSAGSLDVSFRTGGVAGLTSAYGSNGYGSGAVSENALEAHPNLQPYGVVNKIIKF